MKVVALAGGIGGAKLAQGLAHALPAGALTIIVNTGDDFEQFGLHISPDLDTVCYTLAGLANPESGWGRDQETWNALGEIGKLGGPVWFHLGDYDLGTHLERTRRLNEGHTLSEIVRDFCRVWGIEQFVLPMTDAPARTIVQTKAGDLAFQEYFVQRHCEPAVTGFRLEGGDSARPAPGVVEALARADRIVICPSNPWVSIGPILSIRGIQSVIDPQKTVAVSPIIGGRAVKGPAAKMYSELGIQPSATAVARHYRHVITHFVLDTEDAALESEVSGLGMRVLVTGTLMGDAQDRLRLARSVLDFVGHHPL
jgi:LPPG:FO 2-phospho-L-lactate transferase